MSAASWTAFVLAAAALAAYALWTYRKREFPVRGRNLLAGLRSVTLALVLLLLWNPAVPGEPAFGGAPRWLLVDASTSMGVPGPDGGTPWDSALAVVRRGGDDALLATFGDGVDVPDGEGGLPPLPGDGRSALAPALERAAEAGAREVTVVSDLRLEDPVAVEAAVTRLGLDVRWVDVGDDVRNAGVEALVAPAAVRSEEEPTVEVVVFASGAAEGDSLLVEVLEEGRAVASRRVAAPSGGRRARVTVELPAPDAGGTVRYEGRVSLDGDVHGGDDAAAAYVEIAPEEGALVLVSLAPDWEPRFLLPVLAGVTGLRPRGFLRAGAERFLPTEVEGDGGPVAAAAVASAAGSAELLVLHGVGDDAPAWVREAAAAVPRLLLLPAAPGAAELAGITASAPRPGEWYVSPDLPPSPLAGELSGVSVATLPPLDGLLVAGEVGAGQAVFGLQLRGAGPALPGMVLTRDDGGRRTATALASGFWRWAFRPGDAREVYRRLWSGVAGWLLAEPDVAGGPGVAPVRSVVASGEAPLWTVGADTGDAGDTLALRIERGDSVVLDTALAAPAGGTFRTPALPPGTYAWTSPGEPDAASGRFDVASAPELAHRRMAPPADGAGEGAAAARPPVRRPVRTHPLPYLLLLALLAGEWTLRRRRGLR